MGFARLQPIVRRCAGRSVCRSIDRPKVSFRRIDEVINLVFSECKRINLRPITKSSHRTGVVVVVIIVVIAVIDVLIVVIVVIVVIIVVIIVTNVLCVSDPPNEMIS